MSEEYSPEISPDLRERANYIRYNFFEEIEQNLLRIENRFADNGIEVLWAPDTNSLSTHILENMPKKSYNKVCFDIPEIPNELKNTGPLIHECDIDKVSNHEQEAETLVVNADFAIAEDGSLVFVDSKSKNIFNIFSNIIVIVNIDQILANKSDLSLILKLKSKKISNFPSDVKILSKPFHKIIADSFILSDSIGFTEDKVDVKVILYENGISDILQDVSLRESLYCIHCGRCLDVCPVAKASHNISPIQIVKNNCFDQYNKTLSIFSQTSLCGMCQEVCPVNIPIKELLIYEMNMVNSNHKNFINKKIHTIFEKRSKLNKMNSPFFRFFLVKSLFGNNKSLYTYFKNNKSVFYNIEISENSDDDSLDKDGIF